MYNTFYLARIGNTARRAAWRDCITVRRLRVRHWKSNNWLCRGVLLLLDRDRKQSFGRNSVFSELCFRWLLNFRHIFDDDNNNGSIIIGYNPPTRKKVNCLYWCCTEEAKKCFMGSLYRSVGWLLSYWRMMVFFWYRKDQLLSFYRPKLWEIISALFLQ